MLCSQEYCHEEVSSPCGPQKIPPKFTFPKSMEYLRQSIPYYSIHETQIEHSSAMLCMLDSLRNGSEIERPAISLLGRFNQVHANPNAVHSNGHSARLHSCVQPQASLELNAPIPREQMILGPFVWWCPARPLRLCQIPFH